jgi:hypothetical protein
LQLTILKFSSLKMALHSPTKPTRLIRKENVKLATGKPERLLAILKVLARTPPTGCAEHAMP